MEFLEAVGKIENVLETTKIAVLATANRQGIVSASQMCLVNIGMTVYFQTDKNFEKARNITENPYVAINAGACYFKGAAEIVGHPNASPEFVLRMKSKHPGSYEAYTNLPDEVLIRVDLIECRIWGAEGIQIFDFAGKTVAMAAAAPRSN